jgi:hypothetical protein
VHGVSVTFKALLLRPSFLHTLTPIWGKFRPSSKGGRPSLEYRTTQVRIHSFSFCPQSHTSAMMMVIIMVVPVVIWPQSESSSTGGLFFCGPIGPIFSPTVGRIFLIHPRTHRPRALTVTSRPIPTPPPHFTSSGHQPMMVGSKGDIMRSPVESRSPNPESRR